MRRPPLARVDRLYVFDGTKTGWYVESDPVMPLGVYGSSKAEGERLALQCEGSTVLRTAWLFGALGQNFVTTMLRLARERPSIGVVADQHGCPTAAKDVAVALVSVAQACLDGTIDGGLFHLTSPVPANLARVRRRDLQPRRDTVSTASSASSRRPSIRRARGGRPTVASTAASSKRSSAYGFPTGTTR
jgi:dTDP-4-dehydrorhamnose reductase